MSADAVRTWPSAHTTWADNRLSTESPCLRRNHPSPPPSVSPARPVSETMPDGATRPWAWVSWSRSPISAPPCARTVRASGSTVDAVHQGEVEEQAAVDAREPCDRVTAATDGHEESVVASEVDRADHVGRAGRAHHDCGLSPDASRCTAAARRRYPGSPGVSTSPLIVIRSSSRLSSLIFASEPFMRRHGRRHVPRPFTYRAGGSAQPFNLGPLIAGANHPDWGSSGRVSR